MMFGLTDGPTVTFIWVDPTSGSITIDTLDISRTDPETSNPNPTEQFDVT
jgi:hypothetical protein